MDLSKLAPPQLRLAIRRGDFTGPTCGLCPGYAQANLVVLPQRYAYDFLLFAQRNPAACPVLEVSDAGARRLSAIAPEADIARDIPRYRVYRDGVFAEERLDVADLWQRDFVSFLIGCSFSFEMDLLEAGIPVRQIEEGKNVPMYITNIPCAPAGVFAGAMVVSMRPIPRELAIKAACITAAMPRVHGAPVHMGTPEQIGIVDIAKPDFGDAVTIRSGEVPVFWPCGVTPQVAVMLAKPDVCLTHAPGHMLVTDVKNINLKY
ncbi:MAG: putative hydro-lyase [Oscillospiraceae bacterium]|nr:putative hydro-lyase [Oscillospiraceae bacterium]